MKEEAAREREARKQSAFEKYVRANAPLHMEPHELAKLSTADAFRQVLIAKCGNVRNAYYALKECTSGNAAVKPRNVATGLVGKNASLSQVQVRYRINKLMKEYHERESNRPGRYDKMGLEFNKKKDREIVERAERKKREKEEKARKKKEAEEMA